MSLPEPEPSASGGPAFGSALRWLLPAVTSALAWAPVALCVVCGAVRKGWALTPWGVRVIGMADDVQRLMRVGGATRACPTRWCSRARRAAWP